MSVNITSAFEAALFQLNIQVEVFEDFAANTVHIRASRDGVAAAREIVLTRQYLRAMDAVSQRALVEQIRASVELPTLVPVKLDLPEGDLPGGIVNWPVAVMDDGQFIAFQHPLWPDETFQVRFVYSSGPWTEVRLEWPGHGNIQMPSFRASNTYVREVIAEAMAMVSVLMV